MNSASAITSTSGACAVVTSRAHQPGATASSTAEASSCSPKKPHHAQVTLRV